jgi:hypothetical protein
MIMPVHDGRSMKRELCMTGEKWFASGELKIFRLAIDYIKLLIIIIYNPYNFFSEKDFARR